MCKCAVGCTATEQSPPLQSVNPTKLDIGGLESTVQESSRHLTGLGGEESAAGNGIRSPKYPFWHRGNHMSNVERRLGHLGRYLRNYS